MSTIQHETKPYYFSSGFSICRIATSQPGKCYQKYLGKQQSQRSLTEKSCIPASCLIAALVIIVVKLSSRAASQISRRCTYRSSSDYKHDNFFIDYLRSRSIHQSIPVGGKRSSFLRCALIVLRVSKKFKRI